MMMKIYGRSCKKIYRTATYHLIDNNIGYSAKVISPAMRQDSRSLVVFMMMQKKYISTYICMQL